MDDANRTGNLLLDALTPDERGSLLESSDARNLVPGDTWRQEGDEITSVAFPTVGTLSLIAETGDNTVEAATNGREGAADVFAAIASEVAPLLLIAQVPGNAIETPLERFSK